MHRYRGIAFPAKDQILERKRLKRKKKKPVYLDIEDGEGLEVGTRKKKEWRNEIRKTNQRS